MKTALKVIRAAVDVMGEARQYMELRGELTGELLDSQASITAGQLVVNVLQIPRIGEVAPEPIEGSATPAALPPPTLKR